MLIYFVDVSFCVCMWVVIETIQISTKLNLFISKYPSSLVRNILHSMVLQGINHVLLTRFMLLSLLMRAIQFHFPKFRKSLSVIQMIQNYIFLLVFFKLSLCHLS